MNTGSKRVTSPPPYTPVSGLAWRDELQSFLPHALDCLDQNCLLPLCVSMKLTLRHVQSCRKLKKCATCQQMKSIAKTHSSSCHEFYCRVPFCYEAKVTAQQEMLMEVLAITSIADLQAPAAINDPPAKKHAAQSTEPAGSLGQQKMDGDGLQTFSAEWGQTSSLAVEPPAKSYPKQTPKQALQSRTLVAKAAIVPPTKMARLHTDDPSAREDGCLEIEIIESKSPWRCPGAVADPSLPATNNSHRQGDKTSCSRKTKGKMGRGQLKQTGSSYEKSPKATSRKTNPKHHETERVLLTPSTSVQTGGGHLSTNQLQQKSQSFSDVVDELVRSAGRSAFSSSNLLDREFQPVYQVSDESVECSINETNSTPSTPPATFEMPLEKPPETKDSSLKTVLLETLFQLLAVVTQPKTKQQEALFVGLLERTLREMRVEVAKQSKVDGQIIDH